MPTLGNSRTLGAPFAKLRHSVLQKQQPGHDPQHAQDRGVPDVIFSPFHSRSPVRAHTKLQNCIREETMAIGRSQTHWRCRYDARDPDGMSAYLLDEMSADY